MTRAGREPAEDVKHRLVAACQEVGLTVTSATMHLLGEAKARIIHVGASLPSWPYQVPSISLMSIVPVAGDWPEFVDIRCCGTEEDPVGVDGPWMKGRDKVPFAELIEQLQATLAEREKVIGAVKSGLPGPYKFERSVWERVDLSKGGA